MPMHVLIGPMFVLTIAGNCTDFAGYDESDTNIYIFF